MMIIKIMELMIEIIMLIWELKMKIMIIMTIIIIFHIQLKRSSKFNNQNILQ